MLTRLLFELKLNYWMQLRSLRSYAIFYDDYLAGGRLRHRKRIDVDECLSRENEDASSLTAVSTMM